MTSFRESTVEGAALACMQIIGWQVAHGFDIVLYMPASERAEYGEVVLAKHLRDDLSPKLISGELRLEYAERFIGRAI